MALLYVETAVARLTFLDGTTQAPVAHLPFCLVALFVVFDVRQMPVITRQRPVLVHYDMPLKAGAGSMVLFPHSRDDESTK
ncbi:uncharacterized protein SPSK_02099 [Sporothrix schenckii 1099-18]|uniref:Uncharacterized protein n=1 Tax=Sporothrix schenckii 1099-18 TaxID=1397361 RepID=A0A0F2MBR3_SPOSC|nr:uncharacterized protein SPSK_02099 [Sporothrix schenckii 1099-18]KJR87143.1 hypothetical protein SPSK_02099 [Sporothrix schenckii 1099-18]